MFNNIIHVKIIPLYINLCVFRGTPRFSSTYSAKSNTVNTFPGLLEFRENECFSDPMKYN